MKKSRILFLHLGHSFGGIEVYMANLAALLREDADIAALCSHPRLIENLMAEDVRILGFPKMRGPLRGLRFLLAAIMLPCILFRYRIDTVHINGHWESMLLLPCRLFGRRAISTRHQTWDIPLQHWWHAPKRTLASLTYNANARFASKVICVSEAVAAEVHTRLPVSKLVVIPNWIATQPAFMERSPHGEKIQLLFVGRMTLFKGLHLLLKALRGLHGVALTAVGEGAMLDEFREQARGLDVTFTGFRQDVQPFYRAADIFIMPSIGLEGLPLVALEAMGHGMPCLFSDLPVHREITAGGCAAALFRTGDIEDLRHRLQAFIDDEATRRSLARAAYEIVRERYTAIPARHSYKRAFHLTGNPWHASETTYDDCAVLPQRSAAAK